MATKDGSEYGGQTHERMSNRPLQKQSTAKAAGKKGAAPRMETAVEADPVIAGTRKGGPATVRSSNAKSGATIPRRFKVKRYKSGQKPDAEGEIGMQDRPYKGAK